MTVAKRISAIAGALITLTTLGSLTPSLANEISAKSAIEANSAVDQISTTVASLSRLTSYLGAVVAEVGTVSKREIAVGQQYRCLAQAVYFEARGESDAGQRAVAHVVLNRVKDRRYPQTVCGVVFQNEHLKNRCQFSFACDGRSDRPHDITAWRRSLEVALQTLAGVGEDVTNASTHYHARYVAPTWAPALVETARVGQHIFYRENGRAAAVRSSN
jgi:hypothetical protein